MNWPQLHTAATPVERVEITALLLRRLALRQRRLLFVRGRFVRDRRRACLPVFVAPHERRRPLFARRIRVALQATFASGLLFPALLLFVK